MVRSRSARDSLEALKHQVEKPSLSSQFLAVAAFVMCNAMVALGAWVGSYVETGMVRSAALSSSILMESFLAPYVQEVPRTGIVDVAQRRALDALFAESPLGDSIQSILIRGTSGEILYSTNPVSPLELIEPATITRVISGETVVNFERHPRGKPGLNSPLFDGPLIEVFAPLYHANSREIVAIGEVHQRAADFEREVTNARHATWMVVGLITFAMILALYLVVLGGSRTIARQRHELEQTAIAAQELSAQNEALRISSDNARLDAGKAHEQLLGRIGADLHDGPIQLLGLLMFRLTRIVSSNSPGQMASWTNPATFDQFIRKNVQEFITLTQTVVEELRNLSAGLVLPELDGIELEAALRMAVTGHEELMGTKVGCELIHLPQHVSHATKTCLYRVVQEALNNAARYASGFDQLVVAIGQEHSITLEVSDTGPGLKSQSADADPRKKLGLLGMTHRVRGLDGTLTIESRVEGGTRVRVTLPLSHLDALTSSGEPAQNHRQHSSVPQK